MKLIICRGVPGAGKSTFTSKIDKSQICSADFFFLHNNEYRFDRDFLGTAHKACFFKFRNLIKDKAEVIVIDNTNIKVSEFSKYVQCGIENGYEIQVIRFDTPLEVCIKRNTHGVPPEKVTEMYNNFEPTPSGLKEMVIQWVE